MQSHLRRHDKLTLHVRVDTAEVIETTRLIETARKALVGVEHAQLQTERGTDDAVRYVVVVHPSYHRARTERERRGRKREIVDPHLRRLRRLRPRRDQDDETGSR